MIRRCSNYKGSGTGRGIAAKPSGVGVVPVMRKTGLVGVGIASFAPHTEASAPQPTRGVGVGALQVACFCRVVGRRLDEFALVWVRWRWVVRLNAIVSDQGCRLACGEPAIGMKLVRISVPALGVHRPDRTAAL